MGGGGLLIVSYAGGEGGGLASNARPSPKVLCTNE